jgi:GPH family glycoside/pentoside/hexuronide:cation symporter
VTAPAPPDRVPLRTKLAYAAVNLPLSFVGFPLVIYLAPFYAGELGIPLAVVGAALFVGRLTDVVSDFLIGVATDRVRTPIGRRRPWVILGGLVMLVGVWQLFMPPPSVQVWHLLVWVGVVYLGFTMVALPHEAWGAELTGDYAERTRITATRQFYGLTGLVVATIVPAVVMGRGGDSGDVLHSLGWLFIALMPVAVVLLAVFVREPNARRHEAHVPFVRGLRIMARNGPFKRVIIVLFIAAVGETFRVTITYFFAQSVIGVTNLGAIYLWYFGVGLAAVPVWNWLGNSLGKHRALALSFSIISAVSLATFALGPGDVLAFTVLFTLKGFCFGSLQLLPSAMVADIVDVDAARSGQQRQGLFYAVAGLALKLGMAFGQGVSLVLLQAAGYEASGQNDPQALFWLRVFYCLVPVALFVATLRLIWRYPLTRLRHQKLRGRLAARAERLAAAG